MKRNAKHECAEALRRRILSMELAPGSPLDEIQLAVEYGISRTPLREVLQRLAGEGYVVVQDNRGAKVASLDLATLRHFFLAAPMIYAAVARLAAQQASQTDLKVLRDIQSDFRTSVDSRDVSAAAHHNHRFHAQIGSIAASPFLTPSLNRLLIDHTRIGHTFYEAHSGEDRKRVAEAVKQHDAMIEAFADRDAEAAVALTMQHWELSRGQMGRFVNPDALPIDLGDIADAV
ncbi:MAG: GntR family transcriptional regulator [Ahrensia sp.]|nr:GntR family transcriptional regulator [Ahrensia sp.]